MPETGGALEPRITELFGAPRATEDRGALLMMLLYYVGGSGSPTQRTRSDHAAPVSAHETTAAPPRGAGFEAFTFETEVHEQPFRAINFQ